MIPKLTYKIGDECWISLGSQKLSEGRVVATLTLPNHPAVFYVIELADNEWPHLEVRDALLMAPEKGQPLAFMQRNLSGSAPGLN